MICMRDKEDKGSSMNRRSRNGMMSRKKEKHIKRKAKSRLRRNLSSGKDQSLSPMMLIDILSSLRIGTTRCMSRMISIHLLISLIQIQVKVPQMVHLNMSMMMVKKYTEMDSKTDQSRLIYSGHHSSIRERSISR